MSKIIIKDEQVLAVVMLLKVILGSTNRDIRKLLEKIDTPEEIAKIHTSVQNLVDLVQSL